MVSWKDALSSINPNHTRCFKRERPNGKIPRKDLTSQFLRARLHVGGVAATLGAALAFALAFALADCFGRALALALPAGVLALGTGSEDFGTKGLEPIGNTKNI